MEEIDNSEGLSPQYNSEDVYEENVVNQDDHFMGGGGEDIAGHNEYFPHQEWGVSSETEPDSGYVQSVEEETVESSRYVENNEEFGEESENTEQHMAEEEGGSEVYDNDENLDDSNDIDGQEEEQIDGGEMNSGGEEVVEGNDLYEATEGGNVEEEIGGEEYEQEEGVLEEEDGIVEDGVLEEEDGIIVDDGGGILEEEVNDEDVVVGEEINEEDGDEIREEDVHDHDDVVDPNPPDGGDFVVGDDVDVQEQDIIDEEVVGGEEVEENGSVLDSSADIEHDAHEIAEENDGIEENAEGDAVYEEQGENQPDDEDHVPSSTTDMYKEQRDEDVVETTDVGDEYEDAVEVEEGMQEDEPDENVAEHVSDSDDDQEETASDGVKLGHVSDDDVRGSDNEETQAEIKTSQDQEVSHADIAKMFDSESEDETAENEGDLINDIFGASDDEDEEFTGFGVEDVKKKGERSRIAAGTISSDSDEDSNRPAPEPSKPPSEGQGESDSDEGVKEGSNTMVSDFDLMMQRKKNERKGRRRKDGGTFISDADDIINAMLTKMREAAVADREANQLRKPALNKLKMLPTVIRHLKKQDLKESFVDMGMIAAVVDWLTLLPDRSLPHLSIRTELLKVLHDLPGVSSETLKTSGIGRAVMLLFKHPRETRENRESAGRLINKWSRPIFGLNDNFKSMSRGDREQRDLEHMPQSKRRRLSAGQSDGRKEEEAGGEEGEQLRPGEQGFVMRARVPAPSHKDYVIRPKWKIGSLETEDGERFNRRSKSNKAKKDDRLEKHLKTFADRRKNSKMQRAVGISIEGSKMPLT